MGDVLALIADERLSSVRNLGERRIREITRALEEAGFDTSVRAETATVGRPADQVQCGHEGCTANADVIITRVPFGADTAMCALHGCVTLLASVIRRIG